MVDYYLDVYSAAGVRLGVVTDFTALSYTRKCNAPGVLQFGLSGDHSLAQVLAAGGCMVNVMRQTAGGYRREMGAFIRQAEYYYSERANAVFTGAGVMSLLGRRIIAWPAGTANRSKFTGVAAETIMKSLVTYNAGSGAMVANGRTRDGAISGLTVELDGAHGDVMDWYCAWDNLLASLQKLAQIGGGDFDIYQTSIGAYVFRWHTGQRGSDLTDAVFFSLERGNMANPAYKELAIDERTVCIVGGQGEGAARAIVVRTGPNYSAGNDIEMFSNGSGSDSTAGLEAQGDRNLIDARVKLQFTFDVLQAPACEYGVHYDLGDLVSARNPFTGADMTLKIDDISVSLDQSGAEQIDIQMVQP